jgi:HK97 gp10 family phage protein
MVKFSIKIDKFEELNSETVKKAADTALREASHIIQSQARTSHRYKTRTGNLVRATRAQSIKGALQAYIDDNLAKYGKYIHEGFRSWAPDPFLGRAIESNLNKIDDILISTIETALERDK